MPIIPIIISLAPSLIGLAEKVFGGKSGQGVSKKAFVLGLIEKIYDSFDAKDGIKGDEWLSKDLVLDLSSLLIDHLVPELLKKE